MAETQCWLSCKAVTGRLGGMGRALTASATDLAGLAQLSAITPIECGSHTRPLMGYNNLRMDALTQEPLLPTWDLPLLCTASVDRIFCVPCSWAKIIILNPLDSSYQECDQKVGMGRGASPITFVSHSQEDDKE